MPTPTPTPAPREAFEFPGTNKTTPLPRLRAGDVAKQIRDYLAGKSTRVQLSDWAMSQFVKQDFSQWFDPAQGRLLMEVIAVLIPMDPSKDEEERASFERLAHRLDTAA